MGDVLLFVNDTYLRSSTWVLLTTGFCTLVQRMDFISNHGLFTIIVVFVLLVSPLQSSSHRFSCNELLFVSLVAVFRALEVGAALLKDQPLDNPSRFV